MNLTSKNIRRFLTVCAGVCAFTAMGNGEPTPTEWWVADSFEDGSIDQPIGAYKRELLGVQEQYTNVTWNSTGGESKIVETTGTAYEGTRPLVVETTSKHLQLETENSTLTRYVAFDTDPDGWESGIAKTTPTNISFVVQPKFVDTLIKFTPSEDEPQIEDGTIKMAIYVNAATNLAVYCRPINEELNGWGVEETIVFDRFMDPEKWYRLTIKLSTIFGGYANAFQIWLDGELLTHAKGAQEEPPAFNGSYFFPIDTSSSTLEQISFQGTGAVDDLAVTDGMAGAGSSAILLTLAFNSGLVTVMQGETQLASNDTVEAGSTITITAADWYEIASVAGMGVTYDGDTGAGVTESAGELSAAEAATVTITAQQNTSTGTISTGLGGNLPANKVAAWALDNNLGSGDLNSDMLDEYLLNIAPDEETDQKLKIISVVVGEDKATVTVEAVNASADLANINGTIIVSTTAELGVAFQPQSIVPLSFANKKATIEVPFTAGSFIKVSVQ